MIVAVSVVTVIDGVAPFIVVNSTAYGIPVNYKLNHKVFDYWNSLLPLSDNFTPEPLPVLPN